MASKPPVRRQSSAEQMMLIGVSILLGATFLLWGTGEVEQARELLGLTQTEIEQIPMLERGEALWRVGRRSFIVQHRIDPMLEKEIVDTDANMGARSAPWEISEAGEAVDSAS